MFKRASEALKEIHIHNYRYYTSQHIRTFLTLPILKLHSYKAQKRNDLRKPFKYCHVGIHWIALAKYSQMGTHVPVPVIFLTFLNHFIVAKLATSSKRVKEMCFEGSLNR